MAILIWGAGAIGGTVGAYLVNAGHDVIFVDSVAEHVGAMNASGLRISGPVDAFTVPVTAFTPEALPGKYDTVLLCVKSQHTLTAVQQLQNHLTVDGCVVSVQNGLNELVISRMIGADRTVGAFVNFGADYIEPGHIHRGNRATVVIGELDGHHSERVHHLHRLMLDFDDRAAITDNIYGYLWSKAAYGAQLFATALTDDSIADALAHPRYRRVYCELARETLAVAQAQGIEPMGFDGFDPSAFMPGTNFKHSEQSLDEMVAFNRASAKTHSGVWRDLTVRRRPTEVDIFLPMLELANETGIRVPLLRQLVELIHTIEDGERTHSDANLNNLLDLLESKPS